MSTESPGRRRRLAVVVFADVAGYTELSSRDEDLAIEVVGALQENAAHAVEVVGGRVVKHLGDGVMMVFESVDQALSAAFDLQARFAAHEAVAGIDAKIRVGAHMGEFLEDDDGDLYGDGVNVAARVQESARPGDITVTGEVHRQIRHRTTFETLPLGSRRLKGLAEPVEVWVVAPEGSEIPPWMPPPAPKLVPRGRAAALGMAAAVVTFVVLGITVAANAGSDEGPPASELTEDEMVALDSAGTLPDSTAQALAEGLTGSDTSSGGEGDTTPQRADPPPASTTERMETPPSTSGGSVREPRTRMIGEWRFREIGRIGTDTHDVTVSLPSTAGDATLVLACRPALQESRLAILWPRPVSPDAEVEVRMDRGFLGEGWERGEIARSTVYQGAMGPVARELAWASRMAVSTVDRALEPMPARFDLDGLVRALAELRGVCEG